MSTKFTQTELELFAAHTCSRCFHPDEAQARVIAASTGSWFEHGCPHLRRAFDRDQMPGAWERRRNGPLGETFKCADFTPQTASTRRGTVQDATEAMFDVDPGEKLLVPVDGWPDWKADERARGSKNDHA